MTYDTYLANLYRELEDIAFFLESATGKQAKELEKRCDAIEAEIKRYREGG